VNSSLSCPGQRAALACGAGALLLDLCVLGWLSGAPVEGAPRLMGLLGLHGLALICFFPCFLWLLPASYRDHKGFAGMLILGFGGALPLAGLVFLVGLAITLRRSQRASDGERDYHFGDSQYVSVSEYGPPRAIAPRTILEVLNRPGEEARRTAILALRHLEPKSALPLLRKGLLDSDDRVRLFSQGQFLKLMHNLDGPVRQLSQQLSKQPADLELKMRMAECLHESVYLEVAREDSLNGTLERAIALLDQVIAADARNPRAHRLLLKYAVKNRDRIRACRSLAVLQGLGMPAILTLPWEIEMAFLGRNWDQFKALLSKLPPRPASDPAWREIRAFWTRPAPTKS